MAEVVAALLALAGLLGATAIIWKAARQIFRIDKALPILLKVAEQYGGEGETIKDKLDANSKAIDHLFKQNEEQHLENQAIVKIAEDSSLVANTNAAIVNELTATQVLELAEIREYLHDKVHEIKSSLLTNSLQINVNDKRTARIEKRLDDIIPYVIRHREDYDSREPHDNHDPSGA